MARVFLGLPMAWWSERVSMAVKWGAVVGFTLTFYGQRGRIKELGWSDTEPNPLERKMPLCFLPLDSLAALRDTEHKRLQALERRLESVRSTQKLSD